MNTPPLPDIVSAPRSRRRFSVSYIGIRGGSLASNAWIADGGQLPDPVLLQVVTDITDG